jgi:hypothetical protein
MTAALTVAQTDVRHYVHGASCEVCGTSTASVQADGVCGRCHRAGVQFAVAWATDLAPAGRDVVTRVIGDIHL